MNISECIPRYCVGIDYGRVFHDETLGRVTTRTLTGNGGTSRLAMPPYLTFQTLQLSGADCPVGLAHLILVRVPKQVNQH